VNQLPNTPVPDELAAIRAEMKRLEERESALRSILLSDPDTRTGANWLAEVKTVQQSRVDIKELRACHPDIVEQFEFPTEITRIALSAITEDGEIIPARRVQK
jgi:predicted phage-related endonuclease